MDLTQFIYKNEIIGQITDSDAFNVAFGVDANFVPPMGIMLTSMVMNNPQTQLHVHVFLNSILDEDVARLKHFVSQYPNVQIDLYYVNVEVFKNFSVGKGYTVATYHRIIIAQVLYPAVSKLLYIDADTLCVGKLTELNKLTFEDNILLAVADKGEWLAQHKREIGIVESQTYFNAGVLYIDLNKWNKYSLSDKMMDMLNSRHLSFQDQDALNLIAGTQIKAMPVRFNQFLLMKHDNDDLPEDTVFIHFAGQVKPWQPWCDNPQRAVYDEYRNKSLWKEFDYRPRDYQENRLMGKAARRQGQLLTALKWYYLYAKDKLMTNA